MFSEQQRSPLAQEVERQKALQSQVRERLHAVPPGVAHPIAVALAALSAERTYALLDDLPTWHNSTSAEWRSHLSQIWRHLQGEVEPYYDLSRAFAHHLLGPLHHIDGQAGPDDLDRPQTLAAYYTVVGLVTGVSIEAAGYAVGQLFDALDLRHDAEMTPAHLADAESERRKVARWLGLLLDEARPGTTWLTPGLLERLRDSG